MRVGVSMLELKSGEVCYIPLHFSCFQGINEVHMLITDEQDQVEECLVVRIKRLESN